MAAVERYEQFVRQRGGRGYVLKCDISRYFASVDHGVLQELLRRKLRDRKLLRLLDTLIATGGEGDGKGMPIGNLTSQLFANVYLDSFDHFVKERLRRKHYVRYMDDWVILGEPVARSIRRPRCQKHWQAAAGKDAWAEGNAQTTRKSQLHG